MIKESDTFRLLISGGHINSSLGLWYGDIGFIICSVLVISLLVLVIFNFSELRNSANPNRNWLILIAISGILSSILYIIALWKITINPDFMLTTGLMQQLSSVDLKTAVQFLNLFSILGILIIIADFTLAIHLFLPLVIKTPVPEGGST